VPGHVVLNMSLERVGGWFTCLCRRWWFWLPVPSGALALADASVVSDESPLAPRRESHMRGYVAVFIDCCGTLGADTTDMCLSQLEYSTSRGWC